MIKKVNSFANLDEALIGYMQFFLFRTILNIRPTGIVALANEPDYNNLLTILFFHTQTLPTGPTSLIQQ